MGRFFIGSTLNGPSTQPKPQAITAKRGSENVFPKPAKRPRVKTDEIYDLVSVDSSSEQHDTPRSTNSTTQRKTDKRDSRSQRSSGDRKGWEVNEFRRTARLAGASTSNSRPRHKKQDSKPLTNGQTGRGRGAASSQQAARSHAGFKQSALLFQNRQVADDHISDDEADEADEDENVETMDRISDSRHSRHSLVNGHGTAPPYTRANFTFGSAGDISDDELNQPQSATKLTATGGAIRRRDQAANGKKRSASSPDALQVPTSKRRPGLVNRGDNSGTNSEPAAIPVQTRGIVDSFLVKRAVCEPSFIYPAAGAMSKNTKGATDEPCSLIMSTKGDPRRFKAIDTHGARDLSQLMWITPNFSKVNRIGWGRSSPIVRFRMSTERNPFITGSILFIEFGSCEEANSYVHLCLQANSSIQPYEATDTELSRQMDQKRDSIKKNNMKKPQPQPEKQSAGQSAVEENWRKGDIAEPETPQDSHSQMRSIRAQMRANDGQDSSTAAAKLASQARTPRTPSEVKQLRNVVGSDDEEGGERDERRSERHWRSSPQANRRETTSVRTLRSTNVKARTPSPTPERWTDQNPNWVRERSYQVPLIYERTTINEVDIERLDEGQFLNDEVISFYVKYLHKQLEARDEQMAKKVYVFSSFFWEKLRAKGHAGVKSWTSKIDLLSFDYIVVPINQNAHWYLAIVCNPNAVLPQDKANTGEDEANAMEPDGSGDVSTAHDVSRGPATVGSNVDPIPVESQLDGSGIIDLEDTRQPSSEKKQKVRRGPGPRKYDPKAPRVITLDSLDGSHPSVTTNLKSYLKHEIKEKKGLDVEMPTSFGMTAKDIPFQNNFTDCGVYLLGYLEQFMKDPPTFTRRILQHEGRDWDINAPALRNKIRDLIFELQASYQTEHLRARREKKRLADERKSKSHTPTAKAQPSPTVASEQVGRQNPIVVSPDANSRQRIRARAQSSPLRRASRDQETAQRVSHRSNSRPTQREHTSPVVSTLNSSQSQNGESDAFNASIIVNPSHSMEIHNEQTNTEAETTPRAAGSARKAEQDQHEVLSAASSSPYQVTPRTSESPRLCTAGDFDQRKFLPLIMSPSTRASSEGSSDRSLARPSQTITKARKPDETRSRFFPPSTSSADVSTAKTSAKLNGMAKYTSVPSSSDMEKTDHGKGSTEKKQRPSSDRTRQTIDLTDD